MSTLSEPITLETPVTRGETQVTTLQVRKPKAGELRGVALSDLLASKTDALITVLPRITVPTLVKHEVENLDPADLLQLAGEVVGFLMTKADKATASPTE